jgi:hypothetical protein
MTMDGSGFGKDGDGHYAYLDTEKMLGVTLELIERPKNRLQPEKGPAGIKNLPPRRRSEFVAA